MLQDLKVAVQRACGLGFFDGVLELRSGHAPPRTLKSPKNRLQELTQRSGERPEYRVVQSSGPDHAREFVIEVAVAGEVVGTGTGSSLRAAQTAAAEAGLDALGRRTALGRPADGRGVAAADPPEPAGS